MSVAAFVKCVPTVKRREDEGAGGFCVLPCASWSCVDLQRKIRKKKREEEKCFSKICYLLLLVLQVDVSRERRGFKRRSIYVYGVEFHGGFNGDEY